ncbi:hypothetical protein DXG03_009287 [Asterophora parasitica]|uniref:Amino acid transporter transmembrane domain-containing protein n=1 Tax=Asterophora parasitica TaxID=117018 RepID=A0A9P7G4L3_9AGAR|nr:hypothetical protein DXG03_009287 [Asterophora parasitica]
MPSPRDSESREFDIEKSAPTDKELLRLSSDLAPSEDLVVQQIVFESGLEVRYRTCSWQKVCRWSRHITTLHVLVGARLLNTLSNSSQCTIIFAVISGIVCFVFTLPRTLSQMSYVGFFSTVTMAIAILLTIIFAGVQKHPSGYIPGSEPIVSLFPPAGTGFIGGALGSSSLVPGYLVSEVYHPTIYKPNEGYPQFIAEMKNPKDFPKALWAVAIAEIITYSLCGAIVYHFVGNQYITAPAFGSLEPVFKKIAFSFALPTVIFLGSLYSSVTARFIFFRIFKNSDHLHANSFIAWATWTGIIAISWIVGFIIAQVIPFFSDMLSLMCSLFDGWFGFIFWAMAYLHLHPGNKKWDGPLKSLETLLNYSFILLGVYILVAGTYVRFPFL